MLNDAEREELLRVARRTLEHHLQTGHTPVFDTAHTALMERSGAFVSLHDSQGLLRGCIGTFEADAPLLETVSRMAVAAATRDPRFPPVKPDELDRLHVEISVLSPRRPVSVEDVVVGRDGVHVQRGAARGVLLPQVATSAGWDRETFLAHTCRKAGLPADAWRSPETRVEVFTAEVFAEPTGKPTDPTKPTEPAEE